MKKLFVLIPLIMTLIYCGNSNNTTIKAPGIIDGDVITIKSQVAGTIDQLLSNEGDTMEKDAVVASINADKIINQQKELDITLKEIAVTREQLLKKINLTNETIKYLEKQNGRFQRLGQNKTIPGEQVDSMALKLLEAQTSRFDLTKAIENLDNQIEKLNTKKEYLSLVLKDHTILSPRKAVVMETFVSEGETVVPNTAILDLVDPNSLFVEVFIEESEMAGLQLNQRAKIIIDGAENKDLSGLIISFGQKAEFSPKYIISEKERQSLLYKVKIKIDQNVEQFKIGMPVTVQFEGK